MLGAHGMINLCMWFGLFLCLGAWALLACRRRNNLVILGQIGDIPQKMHVKKVL
jgi:hypothetical protein